MEIELYKFNHGEVSVDTDITFKEEDLKRYGFIDIKNTHVNGVFSININDELVYDLNIKGTYILPDDLTLEPVSIDFDINTSETGENIDKYLKKGRNSLEIYDIIWENIVSEVPISVRGNSKPTITQGDGWEISSKD